MHVWYFTVQEASDTPREGYKSITVPESVFNYFMKEWKKRREELRVRGVRSFSGFVTMLLTELLDEYEKRKGSSS
jgi:hypothetical protein